MRFRNKRTARITPGGPIIVVYSVLKEHTDDEARGETIAFFSGALAKGFEFALIEPDALTGRTVVDSNP